MNRQKLTKISQRLIFDEVEDILNEYVDLLRKAKSCDFVIDLADDSGYDEDEVDDYIDDLEDSIQDIIDLWERVPKRTPIVVFGEEAPLTFA